MRRLRRTMLAALLATLALPGSDALAEETPDATAVERLLREQSQALLDAVAVGGKEVWDRHLDPRAVYVTEAGEVKTKEQLLAELRPLPPGLVGELRIASFAATVHGDTAVATHEDHERLDYFGQRLATRFRTTDTWHRSDGRWRIIATQVLAILEDPPAIGLPSAKLDEYVGVFELNPEVTYTIRREGARLFGRRSGRDETELLVEVADVLFVAGQPRSRKIALRDAAGRVTGLADRREGRDIVWRRAGAAPSDASGH